MARHSPAFALVLCALVAVIALVPARAASHCRDATEAYYLANGADYRGHVNTTASGFACQRWSSQTPNPHEIALDAASGIGDHNYCRNPNGLERAGCFVDTAGGGYQYCDIGDVCTEYPTTKPTVLFSPASGTALTQDGSSNYVTLSCYPRPCSIYYTLGADTVASTAATRYTQPILISASTTVKAYAVYQTASPMRVQASYTVEPTTTLAPPTPLQFLPTDAVVYDQPILVMLSGVTVYDKVLMYWNDDIRNPTMYNGSFWLKNSTSIFAVVNNSYPVLANYRLNITAPALYVYPDSGRYVGGVSVVVRDPQPPSTYYMYVNESLEWEQLSEMLFAWTAVGTSVLDIRALHVHGLESRQLMVYEVVAAAPPTISPDPARAYHRPVNVTCTNPLGVLVPLSVYADSAMSTAVAEDVLSVELRTPGDFTVTCSYVDDLQAPHTTTATLSMVAVPMQSPAFLPECGAKFPAIALSLDADLDLSLLLPGAAATSWSVYGSASAGATVPMVTRDPDNSGRFDYDLFPPASLAQPTTVVVSMTAHSTDPLESDSPAATCAYHLYPLSTAATPYFSARPACATAEAPVSDACLTTVKAQLADCLHFYSTDLLSLTAAGPFALMRMTGIADSIRADMYVRMGWCLAAMEAQHVLSDLHNETSGAMVLATSWHVATPTRKAAQVFTGVPFTVHVEGFHALQNAYHMVRSDYSCEDVGAVPEAVLTGSPYATAASATPSAADGSAYLTFRLPVAGPYKLCAYVADALYTVPFSASPSGDVSAAWTPSVTAFLEVQAQSWPTVDSVPAGECGGLVPPALENTALSVSMAAYPSGAFSALSYAYDNGGWSSAVLPVDAATKMTGSVALKVGPLSRSARRVQLLDTSLYPTVGAARTCVFFVSAATSPTATPVSYLFYTLNTTAVPAGSTGVMLLLQGAFHPSELIVVDVYEASANSSSLQLIRRVSARASAATGYTVALPDAVLGLTAGAAATPFVIHATLDGVQTTATPSSVALSPLSLAMTSCSACASELCYKGECLCKNKKTMVMRVCGSGDDEDSSSSSTTVVSSTMAPATTTSTTKTPGTDSSDSSSSSSGGETYRSSGVKERLGFLLVYLGLLGGILAFILLAIKRGGSRRERAVAAQEITVESA